jgi:hypothetical protein
MPNGDVYVTPTAVAPLLAEVLDIELFYEHRRNSSLSARCAAVDRLR